jgi:hypothetical protein
LPLTTICAISTRNIRSSKSIVHGSSVVPDLAGEFGKLDVPDLRFDVEPDDVPVGYRSIGTSGRFDRFRQPAVHKLRHRLQLHSERSSLLLIMQQPFDLFSNLFAGLAINLLAFAIDVAEINTGCPAAILAL